VTATYVGDGYFSGSSGTTTEDVSAALLPLSFTTEVSPSTITLGNTFSDTATFASVPDGDPAPSGTVTFNVYGPTDMTCNSTPVFTSTNGLNVAGTDAVSDSFTPSAGSGGTGTYHVIATYSGDSTYVGSKDSCGDSNEAVVVSAASAGSLTQGPPTSATVADGAGYSGHLNVTNGVGTVTFTQTSATVAGLSITPAGAITGTTSLAPGTRTISGTDADTNGDSGTWTFALTIRPVTGGGGGGSGGGGTTTTTTPPTTPTSPTPSLGGYDLVGSDGGVFVFGPGIGGHAIPHASGFYGSLPGLGVKVNDIVGLVPTSDSKGYWLVGKDGGVFAFGDAPFYGSLPSIGVHVDDVVGVVADPATGGYWVIGSDGTVWGFNTPQLGDLPFFGIHVANIVGGASTPDGQGLYLVSSAGKVYNLLGDGHLQGDASGQSLNAPVLGVTVDPLTGGYWLLAKDGGIFSFGAPFFGSTGNIKLNQPVVGMVPTADGLGYWLIARDGGVFSFGDAVFEGSLPGIGVNVDNIVGAAPTS
jgi:hypothetical protein